ALRQRRLAETAGQVPPLEAAGRMRTAFLAAVGHDLRTPLAAARAAVESLRAPDVTWSERDRDELTATAAESLERLDRLVADLLDMSRLEAGTLGASPRPVAAEEAVPRALAGLGDAPVDVRVPAGLPAMLADPALLDRLLEGLVADAVRRGPPDARVLVTASALADRVELRVVDRGPGVPPGERDGASGPFPWPDDRDGHAGAGRRLAVSRGLAEAMDGSIAVEETPGGGLTVVLTLPSALTRDDASSAPAVPAPAAPDPSATDASDTDASDTGPSDTGPSDLDPNAADPLMLDRVAAFRHHRRKEPGPGQEQG
ncbi:hypothetical protein DZF91_30770, partial [Actinomadura logoneensis]